MILVFDTETSNLPQDNLPLDHPAQARVVQLACIMYDTDFKKRASFYSLIKPSTWTMQPGAQGAHGITQEECTKYGIDIEDAMSVYYSMAKQCEIFVAHNISFDKKMLQIECNVAQQSVGMLGEDYCTMHLMTDICKLPGRGGKYKWPKLIEAYDHVTGHVFMGAHDALRDCSATAEIFKWLIDRKHISVPSLVLA